MIRFVPGVKAEQKAFDAIVRIPTRRKSRRMGQGSRCFGRTSESRIKSGPARPPTDFAQLSQTKLTMPVLSIGGEKSLGDALGQQMKLVATDVTVVVLKDAGHWLMEERPKETMDALLNFL